MSKTLDELMADYEAEHLADIARDEARRNTPAAKAAAEAKRREDHERGVRLGWWTEDGTPIDQGDDEDDDEDTDDEI